MAEASSAGKNDSIASSCSVTSTGVPKIVVVLMKESSPTEVISWKGTTRPVLSPGISGASWLTAGAG